MINDSITFSQTHHKWEVYDHKPRNVNCTWFKEAQLQWDKDESFNENDLDKEEPSGRQCKYMFQHCCTDKF
jgi:hypothetical protein